MSEQTKAITPAKTKAVVKWRASNITITFDDVKTLICPKATDQEAVVFLRTCQSLQLNPFAGECYLIKYDERDKAAFVIDVDSYLKAAEGNYQYDGCEAGIILKPQTGSPEFREGSFLVEEERPTLAGGWARVYRRDRGRPTYIAVSKAECIRLNREGRPTQFWTLEKQPWMLRKVALKRALVEAFPRLFAGTISTADIPEGEEDEAPEGNLPQAFEEEGKPDWRRFWPKVKSDLGLTQEQARELLHVDSIKKDLIEQGVTMEQMWERLVSAVQQQAEPETGEIIEGEVSEVSEVTQAKSRIDWDWFKESVEEMGWHDIGKWLRTRYKHATGKSVKELVESLTLEQQDEVVHQVQERLDIYRSQHPRKSE